MRGGKKICDFQPISRHIPQKQREIGLRLLLITNRKSYTGFRLAAKLMTLDDFEPEIRGFIDFL